MTKGLWLLIIVFVGLTWSRMDDSHNIGDDFALYIKQAKNITEGKPANDNYFIQNDNNLVYSPQAYSSGFPILLSPIIFLFGVNIYVLKCWMAFLFLASGVFFYFVMKLKFQDDWIPLLGSGMYLFHSKLFEFSSNILSEIPLILFLMIGWYVFINSKRNSIYIPIVLGFLSSICFCIKPIGVIFFLSIFILYFFEGDDEIEINQNIGRIFRLIIPFVLFSIFITEITSNKVNLFEHFGKITSSNFKANTFLINLFVFKNEILAFFGTIGYKPVLFLSKVLSYFFAIGVLAGVFFVFQKEKKEFAPWFVLFFLIVVFNFPNFEQGLRYFIPIIPFLIYFFCETLSKIKQKNFFIVLLLVLTILYLPYFLTKKEIHENKNISSKSFKEVMQFVRDSTEKGALFWSTKPRLISLFGDRNSIIFDKKGHFEFSKRDYKKPLFVEYVFLSSGFKNTSIDSFCRSEKYFNKSIYKKGGYEIIELKNQP